MLSMPLPLNLSHNRENGYSKVNAPATAAERDPSSFYLSPPKTSAFPQHSENHLPSATESMATPHRGLPPPAALDRLGLDRVLPQPQADRNPTTNGLTLGALPSAPAQWAGQDESMRTWLHAKSEEDRRKQEEEKTRQEGLRLEQRKIEQNMLQESLRGGIPPPMVPMVFASMGGANVSTLSLEWAQHYMNQMSLQHQQQAIQVQQQQQQQQQQAQQQQQQQQIQQTSPEQDREQRLITGPTSTPYPPQHPMQPPPNHSQPNNSLVSTYPNSNIAADRARGPPPLQAAPPTSTPRPGGAAGPLSRLNNTDLQIQPPATGMQGLQISAGQHTMHPNPPPDQASSSPTIFFHHYVPPGSQALNKDKDGSNAPTKNNSPQNEPPASHMRSDYPSSPKKRKMVLDHKALPEHSQLPQHPSSNNRVRRRSRQRSDASTRGLPDYPRGRADSNRQSFSEAESGRNSAQPESRPPLDGKDVGSVSSPRSSGSRGSPKRE